jgi:hypothetical protein
MKKNDPKRSQNYHKFLIRQEKERLAKMDKKKQKTEYKEALKGICSKLRLDEDIEIDMDGPKKIITKRAHQVAMKKKNRKQKKEPELPDDMDLS